MKAFVIRAGKVVLRPKRLEDAQDDYDWRCDEELASLDAASPLRQEFSQFVRIYEDELRFPSPWSVRYGIDTLEIHDGRWQFQQNCRALLRCLCRSKLPSRL